MPNEHLIFTEQTIDWETFETPDKAIPVTNFDVDLGIAYQEHRATGTGRALVRSWYASKSVSGSMSMAGWEQYLGWWFKHALMHNIKSSTPAGATTAKQHGFLPKDDTMPLGLSVQVLRNGEAQSIKGLLVNRITFNCQAGQELTLDIDWIARDEAPEGGTWDDDGTAAPAEVIPVYFGVDVPAFMFYQAQLIVGGTATFNPTTNLYSFSGGTEYPLVEMAEASLENNLDARLFWGSKVPRNVIGQDRAVTGRFDLDQSTLEDAFYEMHRTGARSAIRYVFTGTEIEAGHNHMLELVFPNVVITQGKYPAIAGSNDRRMQSVEFQALADSNGIDFAINLIDTQASY